MLAWTLLFTACGLPKDPENTWGKAKSEGLKVGVVENTHYASHASGQWAGTEIELMNQFCRENQLAPYFISGNESDLIKKLEKYQIHVLIGGFDQKTNWKSKAYVTPTYDGKHVFLTPKGENRLAFELEEFLFKQDKK